MKAVVGIDTEQRYAPAWDLFKRLEFDQPEAILVHVVEPILPQVAYPTFSDADTLADLIADFERMGKELLEKSLEELKSEGISMKAELRRGGAVAQMTEAATSHGADMIVAGANPKSGLEKLFLSSVSRGLLIDGKRTMIFGKKEPSSETGLHLVFATDHSEYADKCLERFIKFNPKGISKITVVTAFDYDDSVIPIVMAKLGREAGDKPLWIEEQVTEKTLGAVEKLKAIAPEVEYHVERGSANAIIDAQMDATGADLLVIGAQGHGFMHRLIVGSTAMHLVLATMHNVMVVRAEGDEATS